MKCADSICRLTNAIKKPNARTHGDLANRCIACILYNSSLAGFAIDVIFEVFNDRLKDKNVKGRSRSGLDTATSGIDKKRSGCEENEGTSR